MTADNSVENHCAASQPRGGSPVVRWSALVGTAGVLAGLVACSISTAPARADEVAYLVNVTVRPGYNFPNARAALDYGYGLCDRAWAGQAYPQLVPGGRSDFNPTNDNQAAYLISQAAQELCPAVIWQLRRSAAGYRPSP